MQKDCRKHRSLDPSLIHAQDIVVMTKEPFSMGLQALVVEATTEEERIQNESMLEYYYLSGEIRDHDNSETER